MGCSPLGHKESDTAEPPTQQQGTVWAAQSFEWWFGASLGVKESVLNLPVGFFLIRPLT